MSTALTFISLLTELEPLINEIWQVGKYRPWHLRGANDHCHYTYRAALLPLVGGALPLILGVTRGAFFWCHVFDPWLAAPTLREVTFTLESIGSID